MSLGCGACICGDDSVHEFGADLVELSGVSRVCGDTTGALSNCSPPVLVCSNSSKNNID